MGGEVRLAFGVIVEDVDGEGKVVFFGVGQVDDCVVVGDVGRTLLGGGLCLLCFFSRLGSLCFLECLHKLFKVCQLLLEIADFCFEIFHYFLIIFYLLPIFFIPLG